MKILNFGDIYHVDIPYRKNKWFNEQVKAVKSIHGATWDKVLKVWILPASASQDVINMANYYKVYIQDPFAPTFNYDDIAELPELQQVIPFKEGTKPRPYQNNGIARGLELNRLIIGDDPGLGKTIQAIGIVLGKNAFPCIVIAPASTKENWKREWHKFSNKKAMVLEDKTRNSWHQYFTAGYTDVFIVNYESLKKFLVVSMPEKEKFKKSADLIMHPFLEMVKSVIVDEIHRCKDPTTQQTRITIRITHRKDVVVGLTGTSVVNSPKDLYAQLGIIGKLQYFGDGTSTLADFKRRYCAGEGGVSNTKELKYLLNKHAFFKREKKDVAKDLPDKARHKYICTISNQPEYDHAFKMFKDWLQKSGQTAGQIDAKLRAEAITKMMSLKQISERGKVAEIVEFLKEYKDSGQKVVLFCTLKATVAAFKEAYPEALTITGDDNDKQKNHNIDRFQACGKCKKNHDQAYPVARNGIIEYEKGVYDHDHVPDTKHWLIVCNVKAAGVGITLTASSTVVFAGFPWTFADCLQCEDRTHRIGQVNAVNCYYFLAEGTIDEDMYNNIQEKKEVSNAITGGTDEMQMNIIDRVFNLFNLSKLSTHESGGNDTATAGENSSQLQKVNGSGGAHEGPPKELF